MGKIKHPKNKSRTAVLLREPLTIDKESAEQKKPIFCFQFLDKNYCISKCNKEEKAALSDQLRLLSSNTWAELRQAPKHGIGYEKIGSKQIKRPAPQHIVHQDTTFIAFRFCGKAPMVGYREREIFRIIWLDRDFTLYDH